MSYWMGATVAKKSARREQTGPRRIRLSEEEHKKEREKIKHRLEYRRRRKIDAGKRTYQPHQK